MATITSAQSGNWGTTTTWVGGILPANGDSVIIASNHIITFNVDMTGFSNGLASLQIDGILAVSTTTNTVFKMNGNITVNGKFYYCGDGENLSGFSLVPGKTNTYMRNMPFSPNPLMFEDKTSGNWLLELNSIDEVESTPNSFHYVGADLYVHYIDGTTPDSKLRMLSQIKRPDVGSESKSYLIFNATGTIIPSSNSKILMMGWYNEIEVAELTSNVPLNGTQIPINKDLNLQQGDLLLIGSGTEAGVTLEATLGVYTVLAYDSINKIITLTSGLQTARLAGDLISIFSAPIKISRTSGTNSLIVNNQGKIKLIGVKFLTKFVSTSTGGTKYSENLGDFAADRVKISGGVLAYCINGLTDIKNTIFGNAAYCGVGAKVNIKNCTFIHASTIRGSFSGSISDVIAQNGYGGFYGNFIPIKNCKFLSAKWTGYQYAQKFINCVFNRGNSPFVEQDYIYTVQSGKQIMEYTDCEFKGFNKYFDLMYYVKMYNCLFEDPNPIGVYNHAYYPKDSFIESFNHDRILGNYKKWMQGGRIETIFVNNVVQPGKLKFICESADYPVYRDYPILVPANRDVKFPIGLIKDTADIFCKLQVIEPSNDPLIDSSFVPLAESTAENSIVNQDLGIHYESTVPRQLILRVFCQGLGNVTVDTSSIDNVLSHPVNY